MGLTDAMRREWADSRDGSRWEIRATPIGSILDRGEAPPMESDGLGLDFRSVDRAGLWYHARAPDATSLAQLSDPQLARLLDEARG